MTNIISRLSSWNTYENGKWMCNTRYPDVSPKAILPKGRFAVSPKNWPVLCIMDNFVQISVSVKVQFLNIIKRISKAKKITILYIG
jgi:hypothetical protein